MTSDHPNYIMLKILGYEIHEIQKVFYTKMLKVLPFNIFMFLHKTSKVRVGLGAAGR